MTSCIVCQKQYKDWDIKYLNLRNNVICCKTKLCKCLKTLQENINLDDDTYKCKVCNSNLDYYKRYTFKELYQFLQNCEYENIQDWIKCEKTKWYGKEKQETLLRIFAQLKLIKKLNGYSMCSGNFTQQTITTDKTNNKDFFIDKNGEYRLVKDTGDSSDLTMIKDNNILTISSKNYKKGISIKQSDICNMFFDFNKYNQSGYKQQYGLCLSDQQQYDNLKKCRNKDLKNILNDQNTLCITQDDLNIAFKNFKQEFNQISFDSLIKRDIQSIQLRLHQKIAVKKLLRMKKDNIKNILLGYIQRSGKSYIFCGCIEYDSINYNEYNALILTTAPNETIQQYIQLFQCLKLKGFDIHYINGNNQNPQIKSKKNIFICSKQFLQPTKNEIKSKTLQKVKLNICFIDESHNGGTTELSENILKTYCDNVTVVHTTATYMKPLNTYQIPFEYQCLWDLEDISLCKDIDNQYSLNRLIEKHGEIFEQEYNNYSIQDIKDCYNSYPQLQILVDNLNSDYVEKIIQDTRDNNYGYSLKSNFSLNKDNKTFQDDNKVLHLFYKIFGKYNDLGVPDKNYPDNNVFMQRIDSLISYKYCSQRTIKSGDTRENPYVIICFMPQNIQQRGGINDICQATKKLIESELVIPDYEIGITNSIENSIKASEILEDTISKAKNNNKKGVLILTGTQLSMGVTIPYCDITILMNDVQSFDQIYQMMFRGMTERPKDKQCGFVIDMNPIRSIMNTITYSQMINSNEIDCKKSLEYFYKQRIIQINTDQLIFNQIKFDDLIKLQYDIYKYNFIPQLSQIFKDLKNKIQIFTDDQFLNDIGVFMQDSKNSKQKQLMRDQIQEDNLKSQIKPGTEQIQTQDNDPDLEESSSSRDDTNQNELETKTFDPVNIADIFYYLIPYLSLLTLNDDIINFQLIIENVNNNEILSQYLIQQMCNWWNKDYSEQKIQSNILNRFITMYSQQSEESKNYINKYTKMVKQIFKDNRNDPVKLSQDIDEYLKALDSDVKTLAEVATPYKLRQEMLDLVPKEFWKSVNKVFEPSAGKGGFLIDIYYRFFEGLKELYPNEKERRKVILEQCIYFSEFNSMNVYICELLLQSTGSGKCKLNSNCGDTLILDINKKWGISGFDLVVGNPPYTTSQIVNSRNSTPLYDKFVIKFIDNCQYLNFIIPNRWFINGKGLQNFKYNILKREDIQTIINYTTSQEIFGQSIDIKGGCCILFKNQKYQGMCNFNNYQIKLNQFNTIIQPQFYQIINKISNQIQISKIKKIAEIFKGRYFGIETNDIRLSNNKQGTQCYVSQKQNKNRIMYINIQLSQKQQFWKVISTTAVKGAYSGFQYLQILNPDQIHNSSYVSFQCKNENEAINLKQFLQLKLINFLLSVQKSSQTISEKTLYFIPLLDLNISYTDQNIYEYFNLTEEEIKLIEENV